MKNKEIEELLNKFKNADSQQFNELVEDFDNVYKLLLYIEQLEKELKEEQEENYKQSEWLVEKQKMIEQLETDYKEANESVTWWQNRYNAIVKQNDDNHKKIVKLENNRDKALKIIDSYDLGKYDYSIPAGGIIELREALKGDSDD